MVNGTRKSRVIVVKDGPNFPFLEAILSQNGKRDLNNIKIIGYHCLDSMIFLSYEARNARTKDAYT